MVMIEAETTVEGSSSVPFVLNEDRFDAIFAEAPIGQALYSIEGRFLHVNRALCEMFGYTEEELLGRTWQSLASPDELSTSEALKKGMVRGDSDTHHIERQGIRKDGSVVDMLVHVSLLKDDEGTPRYFNALLQDISLRKQSERSLKELTAYQATLTNLGRLLLTSRPVPALLQEVQVRLADTLGVDLTSVIEIERGSGRLMVRAGTGWTEGIVGSFQIAPDSISGYTVRQAQPLIVEDLPSETRFRIDSMLFEHGIVSAMSVLMHGQHGPSGILAVFSRKRRSFTEKEASFLQEAADILALSMQRSEAEDDLKRSFDILRKTDQERRMLMSRLVTVQEEERRRIAGDIHDDSIQVIAALGMQLHAVGRKPSNPETAEALSRLENSASRAVDRLRRLIFSLHPTSLDRQGLAAALAEYLDSLKEESGLAYELDVHLSSEPSPEARATAYRISQEALHNVRKHARAKRVHVHLDGRDGGVFVRIKDDGLGFDILHSPDGLPGHLGLGSMRERAEMVGGWSRIASRPGVGTIVQFWIPSDVGAPTPSATETAGV
jgi:PAS domain S-box-containing protein